MSEATGRARTGESARGKGFICLFKMAFRAHQAAQERRRGLAGHLLRRGSPLGTNGLNGQTTRARAALFGGGKFSTTESKPHERESYSFQNSVAVFIMLVMRSNSKPSSRVFLYCPRYPCIMPKNPYIY